MRVAARQVEAENTRAAKSSMREEPYLLALSLIGRLHHRLLDVIKDELDRQGRRDLTPIQGLLLYSIGEQELCIGELRTRGCYLGTNVTYNLKKLVTAGLIEQRRSHVDRRSVHIRLTDSGREVHQILAALYLKHSRAVEQTGSINEGDFATINKLLHRVERFWIDQIAYRL